MTDEQPYDGAPPRTGIGNYLESDRFVRYLKLGGGPPFNMTSIQRAAEHYALEIVEAIMKDPNFMEFIRYCGPFETDDGALPERPGDARLLWTVNLSEVMVMDREAESREIDAHLLKEFRKGDCDFDDLPDSLQDKVRLLVGHAVEAVQL